MYLGSNSFFKLKKITSLQQAYSFFQNFRIQTLFLIKGEMIADLQDAGKTPDKKQRFIIQRIILIIEDSETSIILLEKVLTHK